MNKLIKIELERAFKNKMLIISVVIGLVIVGFNIWNEIIPARKTLDKLLEMGKYSGIQLPGLYMKWMGVRPGSYVFLYYLHRCRSGERRSHRTESHLPVSSEPDHRELQIFPHTAYMPHETPAPAYGI